MALRPGRFGRLSGHHVRPLKPAYALYHSVDWRVLLLIPDLVLPAHPMELADHPLQSHVRLLLLCISGSPYTGWNFYGALRRQSPVLPGKP